MGSVKEDLLRDHPHRGTVWSACPLCYPPLLPDRPASLASQCGPPPVGGLSFGQVIRWLRLYDEEALAIELSHAALHHDPDLAAPVATAWLD